MQFHRIIEENVARFGEYRALYFEGKYYTNLELFSRAHRAAGGLRELGIEPGEVVVVHMSNSPDVGAVYGGCRLIGAVICPTLFLLSQEEMRYIIEDCQARAVVTTPEFEEKIEGAVENLKYVKNIIIAESPPAPGRLTLGELMEGQPERVQPEEVSEDELSVLLYTSGTTGKPKGVMLSHRNLYSSALSIIETQKIDRREVGFTALPLSHSFGLTVSSCGYMTGNFGVLQRWFNVDEFFELSQRFKINSMAGVPTMYALMVYHPRAHEYDTSSWKRMAVAAAPCPLELHQAFYERFGVRLMEGYGLTEAAPAVTVHHPGMPIKPGSVGQALIGVEVTIRGDMDEVLPAGVTGEVAVRGPNVMLGYYRRPEETEKVIRDGWLYTGDMGYLDEDGYLFLVERKKDLIIRGGFNIYPREVEEVLTAHPAVAEAAVVGKENPVMGEDVVAFVVANPGAQVTPEEIVAFSRERLATYKCPREVYLVDALPKNVLGKVMRKDLRAQMGPPGSNRG